MCGRIVWVWDAETQRLVQKIDERIDDDVLRVMAKNRYNVPPASHVPVARATDDGARFVVARWGFPIPQRPNGVFNTRIETAFESPMWRGLIGKHQCVLPVKGFYEWRRPEKTPFFVHRPANEIMLLGGVIGERAVGGAKVPCFSIVTTPPSPSMAPLHDRMPVILEESSVQDWLDGDALDLAVPTEVAYHQVGKAVGNTQNDDASLIEPTPQTGLQGFS